jgi:hypothetical protein
VILFCLTAKVVLLSYNTRAVRQKWLALTASFAMQCGRRVSI